MGMRPPPTRTGITRTFHRRAVAISMATKSSGFWMRARPAGSVTVGQVLPMDGQEDVAGLYFFAEDLIEAEFGY